MPSRSLSMDETEIDLSGPSLFTAGPSTSSQIDWHASYGTFEKSPGLSNRKPRPSGPLGDWPKQKPIHIADKATEKTKQVPEILPTKTANLENDGFKKLAEDIKLKSENMKLKLEIAKLKRENKQHKNQVSKLQKEDEKSKEKERQLWKSLDDMTKSRDNARKANDNNRAQKNKFKTKVKRLQSTKFTDGLKKKGAQEMLDKTKFTTGQKKSIINPEKRIRYSKEDVVQALVQKSLGTKAFNHLRKTAAYRIPTRQTQERWLGNLMSSMPGFQTDAILAVTELRKRSTDERFKEAVLVFDEMYLSKKMELHKKTQHILGPYNKVQVVMIRGLTSK